MNGIIEVRLEFPCAGGIGNPHSWMKSRPDACLPPGISGIQIPIYPEDGQSSASCASAGSPSIQPKHFEPIKIKLKLNLKK